MDRVRWARKIAAMRTEDPPREWKDIAKETGLGIRACQKLHRQLMEAGDPDAPADPMAPIQRHLDVLEVTMHEASVTYAAAPEGSSVRVGALRLLKESSGEWIDMLRAVGFLPRQLGAVSAERELQALFREVAELAREHEVSDEFVDAVLRLSERRLTRPPAINGRSLPAA